MFLIHSLGMQKDSFLSDGKESAWVYTSGETVFSWNQTVVLPGLKAGNHSLVSVEVQTRLMDA